MDQLHKRVTDDQLRFLLHAHCQGLLSGPEVRHVLQIGKTRFFALLKEYHRDPAALSIAYHRSTPSRLSSLLEKEIEQALLQEKQLVDDPDLRISGYNYSAVRDQLADKGIVVSLNTIIDRAKRLGCYKTHRKKKLHDREVLTASVGALIQHDASTHRWSPLAEEKWALITSIDDFSRMLLFADFFPQETTWAHIQATQALMRTYGLPFSYYVDCLRTFRFVQGRDSFWRNHVLQTDEADPQWRRMMRLLGVEVTYALSPQGKGKVERPYRWLQDRVTRTCAREKLTTLQQARAVLCQEVDRYNNRQVHSTTREIPRLRFESAQNAGNSLFRPFSLPKPYTSPKDIFCLRETRKVNAYRRISLSNHIIEVPNVPLYEDVDIHMTPDISRETMELRIWWNQGLVHTVTFPLHAFRVHL